MSDTAPPTAFIAPNIARLAPLFPGYEIEYHIATGGMGAVYKATQRSLDRPVAIKILPREFGQDASYRASFEAEAMAMARLNHPNLIGIYDFGEADGMLFIIMEFVAGKTLFHSAHGIAIAADAASNIVVGVCMGLAHAHEHGILHRDIKPGNILLDQQARPKIGDFGLARPIGTAVNAGETIFGTPHYTAPEVIKHPNSVDARADIFSVGVVLHELLTGRLPAADPRPPSVICGCDPRFDAIVQRATHPLPHLRYPSAAEMANDLRAIGTPAPAKVVKRRPAPPPNIRPAPIRKRPPTTDSSNVWVNLTLVGVAAAIVIAFVVAPKAPTTKHTDPAPSPPPPKHTPPTPVDPLPKPRPETTEHKPPPKPSSGTTEHRPPPPSQPDTSGHKPQPDTTQAPDPPKPDPIAVTPPPPPAPTYNVSAFIERTREVAKQKATIYITEHDKDIRSNYTSFKTKIRPAINRLDLEKPHRERLERRAKALMDEWFANGGRLPASIDPPKDKDGKPTGPHADFLGGDGKDKNKEFVEKFRSLHADYLAKQKKIDEKLEYDLLTLSKSYIDDLKMPLSKLTRAEDQPAVELIKAEINSTQTVREYFGNLMRGINPNPLKEPAPKP